MTIKEMVREHLVKNGYDGLCSDDCGCGLDDLIPCEDMDIQKCISAYEHEDGMFYVYKVVE